MSAVGEDKRGKVYYKSGEIIKRRTSQGEKFYRIHWVGHPVEVIPFAHIKNNSPYLSRESERKLKWNQRRKIGDISRRPPKRRREPLIPPSNGNVETDEIMAPVVGVIDGANTKLSAFKRPLFKADGRRSLIGSLGVRSGRISSTINASTQTIDYLATPPDSKQNRVEASSSSKNQLTNSRPLHDEIDLTSPVTIVSTPFISHNEEGIGENFSKFRGIISHSNESEDMPEGGLTGGVDTNAIPINDSKAPSGFIKGENDNLLHAGAVDFNPALPYCKHQRREDGKKPGEMDVHFFGSEHSNIPGVDLDKSLSSHLPTGSQTPPSHEREVNEATMAIITKDESVLGQSHSHANEVAVNPASRGLFSSSEENEAMETNELALTGGVETPTSSSKKPKKVLERVLREMRDSEGNTFFRVKWQGTRTPEKLSEVEMTEYALGAFKYYRKRISELKRLLGRNKE